MNPKFSMVLWFAVTLSFGCAAEGAHVASAALDELDLGDAGEVSPAGATGGAWVASPLASTRVTSPMSHRGGGGWRRYDCTAISRANHRGTDFGVARGTEVRAAAAGTVIRMNDGCPTNGSMSSTCGGGYGNHVIIAHANGHATLYAHLTSRSGLPAVGTRVSCGDRIGLSGNSGRSSGPHLHFEVRRATSVGSYFTSGNSVDPYGGSCSTQTASLWIGGTPTASCSDRTPRDDAQVVRATHSREVSSREGQRLSQTFTFRNTGSTTWSADEVSLRHAGGAFSEVGEVRLPAGARVAPGQQVDLEVAVMVGSATTQRGTWRMSRGTAAFGQEGSLAVRVPAAPRACRSATLGRDVGDGECVQVGYAGCGMASCGWYQCNDGAWGCTDVADCGAAQHRRAECTPPDDPEPTACASEGARCERDAGCCSGMACLSGVCTDASACELEGNSCGSDAECCPSLSCRRPEIGSSDRLCCASGGARCESADDCCGEMACTGGRCIARARGESCAQSLDCDGAMLCIDGVCGS